MLIEVRYNYKFKIIELSSFLILKIKISNFIKMNKQTYGKSLDKQDDFEEEYIDDEFEESNKNVEKDFWEA